MPLQKLIDFLEENQVKFTRLIHSTAYTAQVIAHRAHISGNMLAKTIVLKDTDGQFVMAVLPANYQIELEKISEIHGKTLELASEDEFRKLFPGCETGGMPPFGNLFGLPVYLHCAVPRRWLPGTTHQPQWRCNPILPNAVHIIRLPAP